MKEFKKYFSAFLITTLGFIPFIPDFGVIDLIATHFFYITIIQILISLYLLILGDYIPIRINKIDIFYIMFLLFGIISFTNTFNQTESIIDWMRYFILFLTYLNLKILLTNFYAPEKIFTSIFLMLFALESMYIFKIYLENFTYQEALGRSRLLSGFSSNQNIAAFSLLIKTPIVIYYFNKTKKNILKAFSIILVSIAIFDILIISSRGAILGLILILFILFVIDFRNKNNFKLRFRQSIIFTCIFLVVSILQTGLYENRNDLKVINRISSYEDNSVSQRIKYIKTSLDLITDNPITGIGIGNWKILSIRDIPGGIRQYEVPYFAHNDFLQVFSEIGIFGFLSYFLIVFYPIFYLIRRFYLNKNSSKIELYLAISLLIFVLDSVLNFPGLRPYSQMNFIYILAFFSSTIFKENKIFKVQNPKNIYKIILVISIPLTFGSYIIFSSYKEMRPLYLDFNYSQNNLQIPLKVVQNFQESFPNINNTTIPLSNVKANYYIKNKNFETAIELIKKGNKHNPFLGFGDFQLSKIYFEKGRKDSALFYIEKAYKKVSKNPGHASLYQTLLSESDDYEKVKEIFSNNKSFRDETIWNNHIYLTITYKLRNQEIFSIDDKKNISDAITFFPENTFFKAAEPIIVNNSDASFTAVALDQLATNFYKQGEYEKAIENWIIASNLIKYEDSYLLNISLAFCKLKKYDRSLDYLRIVEERKIKGINGFFEFLAGYSYQGKKDFMNACNYLRASNKLGYPKAFDLLKTINCQ